MVQTQNVKNTGIIGYAIVHKEGKWNFLKPDGTLLFTEWIPEENLIVGYAIVHKEGKWNFLKLNGTFLSTEWFRYAYDFYEGIAKVQKEDGKWYYLKTDGTLTEIKENVK